MAWAVPITSVVLVWPILFFVPGWVVIRRVVPGLPNPASVGAAIVISVYVSAHLVNVVARLGSFGRESIIVSAVLLALATLGLLRVRHRWLAPLRRPTRDELVVAIWDDALAWYLATAIGMIVFVVLITNGWHQTPDGWVSGGWNWSDLLVHVSIGSSIAAGNFPPEVPYFAGVPLTYHWFADFHGAITSSVAGLDIIAVYFLTSALFAAVLALVVWGLAILLTGSRRVAAIATILVCFGGGMGWIRLVGDLIAGGGNAARPGQPHLVRQHLDRRLAVVQGRLDLRDGVPAPPRDDARPARAGHRRPARRRLSRPAAARRAARRDPRRVARAVPVLRVPGDLPDRLPVRRHDRRLARPDGRSRRGPVPRPDRPGGAVHRRGDRPAARHRGVPLRARLGRGAVRATGRSRSPSST